MLKYLGRESHHYVSRTAAMPFCINAILFVCFMVMSVATASAATVQEFIDLAAMTNVEQSSSLEEYDLNNDGVINAVDLSQFLHREGRKLPVAKYRAILSSLPPGYTVKNPPELGRLFLNRTMVIEIDFVDGSVASARILENESDGFRDSDDSQDFIKAHSISFSGNDLTLVFQYDKKSNVFADAPSLSKYDFVAGEDTELPDLDENNKFLSTKLTLEIIGFSVIDQLALPSLFQNLPEQQTAGDVLLGSIMRGSFTLAMSDPKDSYEGTTSSESGILTIGMQ